MPFGIKTNPQSWKDVEAQWEYRQAWLQTTLGETVPHAKLLAVDREYRDYFQALKNNEKNNGKESKHNEQRSSMQVLGDILNALLEEWKASVAEKVRSLRQATVNMDVDSQAMSYFDLFLDGVTKTGQPVAVADFLGVPLPAFLKHVQNHSQAYEDYDVAMQAGDQRIIQNFLASFPSLSAKEVFMLSRSFSAILRLRRPEFYNMKVTQTKTKREVFGEIETHLAQVIHRALDRLGVDHHARIEVIDEIERSLQSLFK